MNRLGPPVNRLGLRARLGLALVTVALLAVALAALIGNLGLSPRLNEAARTRLQTTAGHVADIAAATYQADGDWNTVRAELAHVAALDGINISIQPASGAAIVIGGAPRGTTAQAAVVLSGRPLATAVVSAASGKLLTPEEQHLAHSLDQLHLVAGVAAAVAAIVAALVLSETLTRPLRRIRAGAERLERGDLDTRVEPGAEPEMAAVARALNRLADTLEHEEQLRKENVADLAHELRTPVNGLLSRIEAAQDGMLPQESNLSAMHAEAERLTRLLDDLARLADAQRPGMLLDKMPVGLADLACHVASSFEPRFDEAGIQFEVRTEAATVTGDPARLEQIVSNLLSNALRYTDNGGRVILSVGRAHGQAFVEVADTGIGIAAEDLRHIYTRFWRADRSRSRATGGTGVGLAIVDELVRAHDGHIDVDSTPGSGSRFRVYLPSADTSAPVPPGRTTAPAS